MTDLKFTSPSGETTIKVQDTGRLGTVAPKTQLHIKMDEPVKYETPMTENSKLHRFFTVEYKGTIYYRFDTYGPEYTVWMKVDKADQVDNVEVYNFLEMVYENVDLDIIKQCRQTGKTRTTTKNLLEKAYYEQMTKEETLECEIKEYTLEIEQKAKEIGNLKDMLDRKEQQLKQMKETDISKVLIEGDIATIMGVKYKRVETPQSFYDEIYGLLDPNLDERVDADDITIRVLNLIRENIPEPYKGVGLPEYSIGFNEAIRQVKMRLFNGIQ